MTEVSAFGEPLLVISKYGVAAATLAANTLNLVMPVAPAEPVTPLQSHTH